MEFYYNYYQKRGHSWFRLILGSFFIFATLYSMIFDPKDQLLLEFVYLLTGVYFIVEGLGYHAGRILGKRFIRLNEALLEIEKGNMKRGLKCNASDIESMELWPGHVIIRPQAQKKYIFRLQDLPANQRHQILLALIRFAENHDIKCTKNGYLKNH